MLSESTIKAAIEIRVNEYSFWTIGVTDNPMRCKGEHRNPNAWYDWDANTEQEARNVEAYFINKGMKKATGENGSANHVYIFIVI